MNNSQQLLYLFVPRGYLDTGTVHDGYILSQFILNGIRHSVSSSFLYLENNFPQFVLSLTTDCLCLPIRTFLLDQQCISGHRHRK